jgi:midasin
MVFEWHDGILVEAMQEGGLLLIDEISLANDSVLERLNSVFEHERTLVLTEKSSSEAIKIAAGEGFNIVATMNPSGDFGKKELSPALRNRMTEIWVESYFLQKELLELYDQRHD